MLNPFEIASLQARVFAAQVKTGAAVVDAATSAVMPGKQKPDCIDCKDMSRGEWIKRCATPNQVVGTPKKMMTSTEPGSRAGARTIEDGIAVINQIRNVKDGDGRLLWKDTTHLALPESKNKVDFKSPEFDPELAWDADPRRISEAGVAQGFGTSTPSRDRVLVSRPPSFDPNATGPVVVLVHGAGASGLALQQHAEELTRDGKRPFVVTMPHPYLHPADGGDLLAAAISFAKEQTGVEKVNLVSHSAGFDFVRAYALNDGRFSDYEVAPTIRFRDDVQSLTAIDPTGGGYDAPFRYPGQNFLSLVQTVPSSWDAIGFGLFKAPLANSIVTGNRFPLIRALTRKQDAAIPALQPNLAVVAATQAFPFTTKLGLPNLFVDATGVDGADDADDYLERVQDSPLPDSIKVHLVTSGDVENSFGQGRLLINGSFGAAEEIYGEAFVNAIATGLGIIADGAEFALRWNPFIGIPTATISALQGVDPDVKVTRALLSGGLLAGDTTAPGDGVQHFDAMTELGGTRLAGHTHFEGQSHTDVLFSSEDGANGLAALRLSNPPRFRHLEIKEDAFRREPVIPAISRIIDELAS